MAGTWKALVLVAGLAAVACLAQRSLSYDEIVTQALKFFNQGRRGQRIFGLLESTPPPPDLVSVRAQARGAGTVYLTASREASRQERVPHTGTKCLINSRCCYYYNVSQSRR